jgi:hypothetical protein
VGQRNEDQSARLYSNIDLPHSKVIFFSTALQELAHSTLIVSATNTSLRRLTHFGLSYRLWISPIDVDGVIRFGCGGSKTCHEGGSH